MSSVLVKMVDASGGAVTGATVTVTVDGVAGTGSVAEIGGGWYRYTFGSGEGASPCLVVATAPLCQTVEVVYDQSAWNEAKAELAADLAKLDAAPAEIATAVETALRDNLPVLDGDVAVTHATLDDSGSALGVTEPDATVTAYLATDAARENPLRQATAEPDGEFRIMLTPGATYVLVFSKPGYRDAERTVTV